MDELKKQYWDVIRMTRSSGRISQTVIDQTEALWQRYDEDIVEQALKIHIKDYAGYKENYTLGIMRNLQHGKRMGITPKTKKNQFNNYPQRDIDMDALEKQLLAR